MSYNILLLKVMFIFFLLQRSAEEYDSAFEGESFLPSKKRHDGPSSSKMAVKDPILQPKAQSFREGIVDSNHWCI